MNAEIISRNLRRLRQGKMLTQEQVASLLGVSPQSISRWECGNTLPDVLLLPELARLYGVTVDDFYREEAASYPSYAQRLLAVYEASGRTADFLAAEQEFLHSSPETISADDLRAWGVLYHYMLKYCAAMAEQKLDQAATRPEAPEWVQSAAAQQKALLLCDLGRGREAVENSDRALSRNPDDPRQWVLAAAARHFAGDKEGALEKTREGIARFPDYGQLYVYAGDIYRTMNAHEEAFSYWRRAEELDPSLLDAAYSMASCLEELEQYARAWEVWSGLAKKLTGRGMTIEARYPEKRAEFCRKKLEG